MKQSFELWAKTRELDLAPYSNPKFQEFDYDDIQTQMFWECWKAAWFSASKNNE